jgi:hypothetical protein
MPYSVFKEVMDAEMNSIGVKAKKPKVVYATRRQTGNRVSLDADKKRKALPPGKRVSKNGKEYYENRKSHSDFAGLNI